MMSARRLFVDNRPKIYGIRHHGAGSSRNLVAALKSQNPDVILIECPADSQHLLPYVAQDLLKPPVAIMIYDQADLNQYAYYPFTSFSPEWLAIQYGVVHDVPIVFFDLPQQHSFCLSEDKSIDTKAKKFVRDPFTYMARLAGFDDTERWWDDYIELPDTAPQMFEAIMDLMREMRDSTDQIKHINLVREAHMRMQIRKAFREGHDNLAVVCGAWHAPALTDLDGRAAKEDQNLLKGLKKVKTQCTWVPWSYHRIARHSGYESGVVSPYWYEALFEAPDQAVFRWMSRASKILNKMGYDFSPAHTIEGSRLAEALASVRGRSKPGIIELFDAVTTVHCRGEDKMVNKLRTSLLEGEKVGSVSDKIPMVPLRQDLENLIKKARLTKDWKTQGWLEKKLDLRKATHLRVSRLLHRLLLLDIPWGQESEIEHNPLGSFHEHWGLEWLPDYEIRIIEASMWGNTIEEACGKYTLSQLDQEDNFADLGNLLYRVLHADLPSLVDPVSKRIRDLGNLSNDVHLLMLILPPLLWSQRYGDTAQLDTASITLLVDEIFPRICLLLPNQAQGISDDVARNLFEAAQEVHQSMQLTQQGSYLEPWLTAQKSLAHSSTTHPLLKGGAIRILLAKETWTERTVYSKVRYELSSLQDPFYSANFLEGLLYGGGWILVYKTSLYQLIDRWFMQLSDEKFNHYLPILRRAFSTFTAAEKQVIFNLLDRKNTGVEVQLDINSKREQILLPTFANMLK